MVTLYFYYEKSEIPPNIYKTTNELSKNIVLHLKHSFLSIFFKDKNVTSLL